jgi:multicomponent Na+:H+ antiporter subunit E
MKQIFAYLMLALPLGLIWMILTTVFSLESYLIGYGFGIFVLVLSVRFGNANVDLLRFPAQAWAFMRYSVYMTWQITLASWDMTQRVLGMKPLRAGIIAVPIGDDTQDDIIGGASAHSITITPGEMVVEYDKEGKVMYVHCVDVEQSGKTLNTAQTYRLDYFKRILGK